MDRAVYKNGQKNNWRRTVWNHLARNVRQTMPVRDAIVLYLPGSADLDRPQALRRGFTDANMIVCERDQALCGALRKNRRNVVSGDLLEILKAWPKDRAVGAIVADLQCGWSRYIELIIFVWMANPALAKATLLLNMQRGRDDGTVARDRVSESIGADFSEMHSWFIKKAILGDPSSAGETKEHRGFLAVCRVMGILQMWEHYGIGRKYIDSTSFRYRIFPSYKSSERSPYMDSVALSAGEYSNVYNFPIPFDQVVRRKIAAALAIRTLRLRVDSR